MSHALHVLGNQWKSVAMPARLAGLSFGGVALAEGLGILQGYVTYGREYIFAKP